MATWSELQVRGPGGVFLTGSAITAGSSSGNFNVNLDPCPIIPINSDVRVVCTSDNAGAEAFVNINMYMAKVIS